MDPRGPLYLQVRARDGRDRPERAESREGRARSKGSRRAEPGPGDRGGRAVVRYSPVTSTRALTRAVLRPQPGAGASERAGTPRLVTIDPGPARPGMTPGRALTALAAVASGGRGPSQQQQRPRRRRRRDPSPGPGAAHSSALGLELPAPRPRSPARAARAAPAAPAAAFAAGSHRPGRSQPPAPRALPPRGPAPLEPGWRDRASPAGTEGGRGRRLTRGRGEEIGRREVAD